jgi:hypothetical protein
MNYHLKNTDNGYNKIKSNNEHRASDSLDAKIKYQIMKIILNQHITDLWN